MSLQSPCPPLFLAFFNKTVKFLSTHPCLRNVLIAWGWAVKPNPRRFETVPDDINGFSLSLPSPHVAVCVELPVRFSCHFLLTSIQADFVQTHKGLLRTDKTISLWWRIKLECTCSLRTPINALYFFYHFLSLPLFLGLGAKKSWMQVLHLFEKFQ